MRLSFLFLSLAVVILVSVDNVQASDEVTARLRSGEDARDLKEKNTGTTTKLSGTDLSKEERGLIGWMMFQSGKSKKALEKLESMEKVEKMAKHRYMKPFNFDDVDETKVKAVVDKMAAAKKASTS